MPEESDPVGIAGEDAAREERLRRFVGPLARRDAEIVDYWRRASAAEHARAMIELADYAAEMVRTTGYGKDSDELFPGFSAAAASDRPAPG